MKKGIRQRKSRLKPSCCRHRPQNFIAIYQNFVGGKLRIFRAETYRFLCLFRSSPVSRAGTRPVQRLINDTERLRVSYTRVYKQPGKASLSFTRGHKSSDLNPAQVCLCNSCEKTPEGLSPSYLQFPVLFGRENSVCSSGNLIRFSVNSVSVAGI